MSHRLVQSWRGLMRPGHRGYAFSAVLTLAIGIGAVVAVYAILHAVLIKPLPYPDEARVLRLAERNQNRGIDSFSVSTPNFLSWAEQSSSFSAIAAFQEQGVHLRDALGVERVSALAATADFTKVLGVPPILGRALNDSAEDVAGAVMLSAGLWADRFAGDPQILGRRLAIDGTERTVVGIAASDVGFGRAFDIWVPLDLSQGTDNRGDRRNTVVARLRDDVGLGAARTEMQTISERLSQQFPKENAGWDVQLDPVRDWLVDADQRDRLWLLMAAVVMLLLITCVNLASLQLARASQRQRDLAIRQALGASRSSLRTLALAESAWLLLLGSASGLVLANTMLHVMAQSLSLAVPRLATLSVDPLVALSAIAASGVTIALFAWLPAAISARSTSTAGLIGSARGNLGHRQAPVRSALVIAQFALATLLVSAALLLAQQMLTLQRTDLGFSPQGLLTARISLPEFRDEQQLEDYRSTLDRLAAEVASIPGVVSTGIASEAPLGAMDTQMLIAPGPMPVDASPAAEHVQASWRIATAGYLSTMRIPLLAGRNFKTHDEPGNSILLSERVARQVFPGRDAVGQMITMDNEQRKRVVGVVGDSRLRKVSEDFTPSVYFPTTWYLWNTMTLTVRTQGDPMAFAPEIRQRAAAAMPDRPLYDLATMASAVAESTAGQRLQTLLLTAFAGIALMIATIGVGSVIAYLVSRRTAEFAVQLALGASARRVGRKVMASGLRLALMGVAGGALTAVLIVATTPALSVSLRQLLPALALAAPLLLIACVLACWLPARRAAAIAPNLALRME